MRYSEGQHTSEAFHFGQSREGRMEHQARLYVGNLPYVAQQADIEALFADNNISLYDVPLQ